MERKDTLTVHLCLVALVAFAFFFTCYVGLPYDFNADYPLVVRGTGAVSYGELVKLTLNPSTPSWFYPPTSRTDLMVYLRPLQFLFLKFEFDSLGYTLPPLHVVTAVGCGLLSALLFGIIAHWTKRKLWGWLAVALYLTFPSNVFMLISDFSADFQFYISILSLTAILLFGRLTLQRSKSVIAFSFLAFLWLISVWLAIKLKSSEKILPVVCLGFLIWQCRSIYRRIGFLKTAIAVFVVAVSFFLVVPSKTFFNEIARKINPEDNLAASKVEAPKDKKMFSLKWQNGLQRTFFVPDGEFSFKSIFRRSRNPLSFTENYGLFLGVLFWLGLFVAFFLFNLRKPSPTGPPDFEIRRHHFNLFLVWFVAILCGFCSSMPLTDSRFLNFAYLPSLIVFFLALDELQKAFFSSLKRSRVFLSALILLVVATCLLNFFTYSKLLGHYGGMQDALVRAEKDIFPLVYGEAPTDTSLYERHTELERRAVIVDWYDLPSDWIEIVKDRLAEEPAVFLYSRTLQPERLVALKDAGIEASLWKQYDLFDSKPLLFRFFKMLSKIPAVSRKLPSPSIFVYKLQRTTA